MNDKVKKLFSWKPMISFISARKISNFLVMGKTYHIEKSVGLFKYGKNSPKYAKMLLKSIKQNIKNQLQIKKRELYAATSV